MLNKILSIYPENLQTQEIARIQTEHRLKLIDFWGIKSGERVLEIGCGQGDTTIALACVVGESGFVHGIDLASPNYGAPETLGQAKERILDSEIGNRIRMDFNTDILDESIFFNENEYDAVVLSHCLWYFASPHLLTRIIERVKPWAKKICIAEWNPCVTMAEQLSHYQAVTIQAICESFYSDNDSNVRTMFYPNDIRKVIQETGYSNITTGTVYSPDMQDATWEVNFTTQCYPKKISNISTMPDRMKELLLAQIEEIRSNDNIKPMSVFVLTAQ